MPPCATRQPRPGTINFPRPAIVQLLTQLDQQPAPPGQLLPWSTYAAYIRENEFVDAAWRLYFDADMWGVDCRDDRRAWMPLVKDHRYASLLDAIPSYGETPDPYLVQKVGRLPFKDDGNHNIAICAILPQLVATDPRTGWAWYNRQGCQEDCTAWELARVLWLYRNVAAPNPFVLRIANKLQAVAPNHPVAVAQQAMQDWKSVEPRAAEVEKESGGNPIIAYGLGKAYAEHGQPAKAIPLLQNAIVSAPDYLTYSALAAAQLAIGDEASWKPDVGYVSGDHGRLRTGPLDRRRDGGEIF